MANNGQDSNLGQQMDKIAYGVAGVIILVLLFLTLNAGKSARSELNSVSENLEKAKSRESEVVQVEEVPDLLATIQKQWAVPQATDYPAWSNERAPSLAQFVKEREGIRINHPAPTLERVTYLRHPKTFQVYLRIEGQLPALENAEYTSVKLLKKAEGDDTFLPLEKFKEDEAIQTGEIRYLDIEVEPGKRYAYQVRTEIARSADADKDSFLKDEDRANQSDPALIPAAIPHDFYVRVQFAKGFDPSKPLEQGKAYFFGEIHVANAEPGAEPQKLELSDPKIYEGFEFGPEVTLRGGKKGKAFVVLSIETNRVEIRDQRNRERYEFTQDSEPRDLVLPVDAPFGAADEGGEEEAPAEEEVLDATEEEPALEEEGTEDATDTTEVEDDPTEEEDPSEDEDSPKKPGRGFR